MDDVINSLAVPRFEVDSNAVRVLSSPSEFYNQLLSRSKSAQKRIYLTSLYLGDGKLEKELVDSIDNSIRSNSSLDVVILLDYLRGTRGTREEKSSATMLKKIADRAQILMYHTPELSGFLKWILPERTNEIVGLQHMKLYIFDDSLIISGANLSDSYFTNRQDRYILFEDCPHLIEFFVKLIEAVGSCSFLLKADGSYVLHESCSVHPFNGDKTKYCEMIRDRVLEVTQQKSITTDHNTSSCDTVVFPVIQMGTFGVNQELNLLDRIFSITDPNVEMTIASGYLNCTPEYEDLILQRGSYKMDIITASPKANGFYGANGMSKHIPALYSSVAETFLKKKDMAQRDRVTLHEYSRDGWTFHGKGLWIDCPKLATTATLVGSSNFGYRSVHRDLEAQVLVVTTNDDLRKRLYEERSRLFEWSSLLDGTALKRQEHHVPTLVRAVSRFIRSFF